MSSVSTPGTSTLMATSSCSKASRAATGSERSITGNSVDQRRQLRVDQGSASARSLETHFGCMRMPASMRIDSAFMYELDSSSTASVANSVGVAQAVREEHVLGELALEGLGALARAVDRRVDQPRQDRVDPDADDGQVAGHREGQADDAALRRRVGGLADLAVLGRHRRRVDDGAAAAVVVRLVEAHLGGGQADAIEGADEVDLDHPAVRGRGRAPTRSRRPCRWCGWPSRCRRS